LDQIEALIVDNRLKPGDSLPTETELAKQLGVSRTVVREAVKGLEGRGLVAAIAGGRFCISAVSPERVSESIRLFMQFESNKVTYEHMIDFRRMLEIEIAGLAAQHAEAADLARMARELDCMETLKDHLEESEENRQRFARADVGFHLAIAAGTGNPLLAVIFGPVIDRFLEERLEGIDRPHALEWGGRGHRLILEAIKNGDVQGAREAMQDHLEYTARMMGVEGGQ